MKRLLPTPTSAIPLSILLSVLLTSPLSGQVIPISSVQGNGTTSPLAGSNVTVEGVVTGNYRADTYGPRLGGIFIVEEESDRDADPETSEGLFIYAPDIGFDIPPGTTVRGNGTVVEYETGDGTSSLTELNSISSFVQVGSAPIPDPAELYLPADLDRLEAFEGMNVRVVNPLVVIDTRDIGYSGELVLAPLPSYDSIPAQRPVWPTVRMEPGAEAFDRLTYEPQGMIVLDDGETTLHPTRVHNRSDLTAGRLPFAGTVIENLEGIIDDRFGRHRLQPYHGGPLPWGERPLLPSPDFGVDSTDAEIIRVASFNVGNYFLTLNDGESGCGPEQNLDCRGAPTDQERERQELKIAAAVAGLDADIIALVEIENTPGVDPLGRLSELLASGAYQLPGEEFRGVVTGTIGTDAIRSAFLYRPDRVEPIGEIAVLDATVDDRFRDRYNRPSIAQRFRSKVTGGTLTIVVNHFKSKGSDCDALGDVDGEDGQGECNGTRRLAAEALADWVASDPTGSDDPDYLIVGDFNAYTMEDPIRTLERGADGEEGTEDDLTRLIPDDRSGTDQPAWSDYTYRFNGLVGPLDHAFATGSLRSQIVGFAPWHVNADAPEILDYRFGTRGSAQIGLWSATPERSSDHDPIVMAVRLRNDSATTDVRNPGTTPSVLDLTSEPGPDTEPEGSPEGSTGIRPEGAISR